MRHGVVHVVRKDLELVVETVIDARNIVPHVDRQTGLAEELIISRVRLRNDSRVKVCHRVGVKQGCRDDPTREGLALHAGWGRRLPAWPPMPDHPHLGLSATIGVLRNFGET